MLRMTQSSKCCVSRLKVSLHNNKLPFFNVSWHAATFIAFLEFHLFSLDFVLLLPSINVYIQHWKEYSPYKSITQSQ